jgi:hypothetical protein
MATLLAILIIKIVQDATDEKEKDINRTIISEKNKKPTK